MLIQIKGLLKIVTSLSKQNKYNTVLSVLGSKFRGGKYGHECRSRHKSYTCQCYQRLYYHPTSANRKKHFYPFQRHLLLISVFILTQLKDLKNLFLYLFSICKEVKPLTLYNTMGQIMGCGGLQSIGILEIPTNFVSYFHFHTFTHCLISKLVIEGECRQGNGKRKFCD